MRILFVADGRSPTALNWISHFVKGGHEVHLASTFPAAPDFVPASLHILHLPFNASATSANNSESLLKRLFPAPLRTRLRQSLTPYRLTAPAQDLRGIIATIKPDLLHAMRIPYEGMLAALAESSAPLLVSVWGNDFTLHAPSTRRMAALTRFTLRNATALHTDCQRDLRLAREWGFDSARPSIVLPGGGGVHTGIFYPPKDVAQGPPTVINPRGIRAYICNDAFFQAVPLVLRELPETRFLCPAMQSEPEAERWVKRLNISDSVSLLPKLPARDMAERYRQSQVMVSPSQHDGTPNTLLEALACGCFPVVGDIESLREWIRHGENGLLVDPTDPRALANAIIAALKDAALRQRAQAINSRLISERAEYSNVMREAELFYRNVIIPRVE